MSCRAPRVAAPAADPERAEKLDAQLVQLEDSLSRAIPRGGLERQVKALEQLARIASNHVQVACAHSRMYMLIAIPDAAFTSVNPPVH